MKYQIGLLASLALSASTGWAQDIEKDFTSKMVDAINYVDTVHPKIWPGFNLKNSAIIGFFKSDSDSSAEQRINSYAFNFIPKNPDWIRLNVNGQPVYHLDKDEYGFSSLAWGIDNIDGQTTFEYAQDNTHDANYQVAKSIEINFYLNSFLFDDRYSERRIVIDNFDYVLQTKLRYIELEALKSYLTATNEEEKNNSIKDAIAIHQYSMTMLNASSRKDQTEMAMFELPYYVGWRSLNLSTDAQYMQALPDVCNITSGADSVQDIEHCIYHDFTSLVYGLFLDSHPDYDDYNSDWKTKVEKNRVSPADLAVKYYNFTDATATSRARGILKNKRYQSEKIDAALSKSFIPYMDEVKKLQENYNQSPGIELEIFNKPFDQDDFKSLKHQGIKNQSQSPEYWVNDNVVLFKDYSTGADEQVKNHRYILHINNIPYLYATGSYSNWGFVWQKFKVTPDTKLVIDGKRNTVGHFSSGKQHMTFKNLLIETNGVKVKITNAHGDLDGTGNNVRVKFKF